MPIAAQPQPQQQTLLRNVQRIPSAEIDIRNGGNVLKNFRTLPERLSAPLQNPPERRVAFSPRVRARPSLHVNDYTDQEHLDSWLTPEEYVEIRKNAALAVKLSKRGLDLFDGHTLRGLEHRTRTGHLVRETNKAGALLAVLNEQLRQRKAGICDDEAIRAVYQTVSKHCAKKAQETGRHDEEEVKLEEIYNSDNWDEPDPFGPSLDDLDGDLGGLEREDSTRKPSLRKRLSNFGKKKKTPK